jgi:hypothetical protein
MPVGKRLCKEAVVQKRGVYEKMARQTSSKKKKLNRELVLRALTDPKFRKLLQASPSKAIGKPVTGARQREIDVVLATVRGIEAHIQLVADELLCANGPGPCGIATA